MRYGLIGEHLGHSYSREVHEKLAGYSYELQELPPEAVEPFFRRREFCAVNVTIPYKETVIPFLDEIDEAAQAIGAVNTVVVKNGRLCGYNTDYAALRALLCRHTASLRGKTVLILGGDGGTARTAAAVAQGLQAETVYRVSRSPRGNEIGYEQAKTVDADVLINATPVGMFPDMDAVPLELSYFPRLTLVVDAIYHPLRSVLVQKAQQRGIAAEGGLYMLVAQAAYACERFTGTALPAGTVERVFCEIRAQKESIVLIGMPGAGKTTVGKALAERLGRPFFDTDAELVRRYGQPIPILFAEEGEAAFREREAAVIAELTQTVRGAVIATGGGAILRDDTVCRLKQNGRLFFLDRSPDLLVPAPDRPIAADREALLCRYAERYARYCAVCDVQLNNDGTPETAIRRIQEEFFQ